MSATNLLLEVRRAQAEAVSHVVAGWTLPDDPGVRAQKVEEVVREFVDTAEQVRQVVRFIFEFAPRDGTLLSYMNRQREDLASYFGAVLGLLRTLREMGWQSNKFCHSVPSLPLLERAIRDIEQLQTDTLANWLEFDPNQKIGPKENYISSEEFFRGLDSRLSEEGRRELQGRLGGLG